MIELSPIAKAALSQLLSRVNTKVREWFTKTPIETAALRLAATHRHGDALRQAMSAWFAAPPFATALFKVQQGALAVDREALASALIDAGFGIGDDTPRVAVEIVDAFLTTLEDELLKSNEGDLFSHHVQMQELHRQSADQRAGMESVRFELEHMSREVTATHALLVDAKGATDELSRRVDAARDQLFAGKLLTARDLLAGIQREIATRQVSPDITYRVFTNLGFAELQLGRRTEAAELFETAFRLRPDDPKARSNRALAFRLRGDQNSARELLNSVLAEHPGHPAALSVLTDLLDRAGDRVTAIRVLEDAVPEDPALKQRLAELYLREKQPVRALEILTQLPARNDVTTTLLRCEAQVASVEQYLKTENSVPWQLPDSTQQNLKDVERALGTLLDRGAMEWPAMYTAARTLRGYTRGLLFRHRDACDDLSGVAASADTDTNVLVNLSVFRIINDQPAEALTAAARALELDPDSLQAWLVMADAAGAAGDWEKSHRAAKEALQRARGHDSERARAAVAEALRHLRNFDEAQSSIEEGLQATPDSHELLSALAVVFLDRGETEKALEVSRRAVELATGGYKHLATIRAADLAFRARRYSDAANYYRSVVGASAMTEGLRRFMISLYETGAFDEALAIAHLAREKRGGPIETVSEVEGAIREKLGQLEEAARLYEQMVATQVTPVRALERLAVVHYRAGHTEKVRNVLGNLVPRAQDDAHALMMCAHLSVALGEIAEAMPLAYRALGLAQDRPEIHLGYAGVIHAIPDELAPQFVCECAGLDTAVTLEVDGESATYIIVADPGDHRLWADEISAGSSIAAAVTGKRAGDVVELPATPVGPRNAVVRLVQSKYIARYQKVLSEFNRRFPDATGLWKIKADDAIGNLKAMLDMRAERIRAAMNAYEQRRITVGLLGRSVGRSGLETWRTLMANKEYRPFVRPDSQDALAAALDALQRTPGVVIDLTAAITLFSLDVLSRIASFRLNVYVPQTVIDAISEEIDGHRVSASRPMLVTYKDGGTYYRHEVSAEQVRETLHALERLRDELRQFTVVGRPAGSLVHENAEAAEALGAEFADAIAIAKAKNLILLSDDLLLKDLAANEWEVRGASSFDLLAYGVKIEQFADDAFERATISMVRWKFRGVPIRTATILLALQRNGYELDDDVRELLEVLADGEVDVGSAIRVALGVLRELWLSTVLVHRLHAVTDAILEALVRNRGPRVLEQLRHGVNITMRLVPQYAHTLNGFIDGFGKQRFSGEVIP